MNELEENGSNLLLVGGRRSGKTSLALSLCLARASSPPSISISPSQSSCPSSPSLPRRSLFICASQKSFETAFSHLNFPFPSKPHYCSPATLASIDVKYASDFMSLKHIFASLQLWPATHPPSIIVVDCLSEVLESPDTNQSYQDHLVQVLALIADMISFFAAEGIFYFPVQVIITLESGVNPSPFTSFVPLFVYFLKTTNWRLERINGDAPRLLLF